MANVPFFGRVALAKGWITEAQLEECLRERSAATDPPPLGQVLLGKRYLSSDQFLHIMKDQEQLRFPCPACATPCTISSTFDGERCGACGAVLEIPADVHESARLSQMTLYLQLRGGHVGKYAIRREIARGASGIVYEAEDPELKRRVAIKIMREGGRINASTVKRFHREAAAAAKLRHPNIVGVHDVGVEAGLHYFVMDLIEGATFREILAARRPVKETVAMLATVARAVDAAHREGIVHRDLKPANILVDRKNQPFVTDFGLAHIDEETVLTKTGTSLGTPYYMPPEQVTGRLREIDARSDVYALGVILYEILTGKPPFLGEGAGDVFEKILCDEAVDARVSGGDPVLSTIAMKAIEKSPARRYQSALAFARDLERALVGDPIEARPVGWGRRIARRIRMRPGPWAVATALFIVAASALAVVVSTRRAKTAEDRAEVQTKAAGDAKRVARAWVELAGGTRPLIDRTQRISRMGVRPEGDIAKLEKEVDAVVASVFAYYPDAPIAYAYRGWFRSLAAHPGALGDLDRACREAPDEPFGFYFRARHFITLYDRSAPLPTLVTGATSEVRFGARADQTAEMEEWKRRALEDLKRLSTMEGWISEGETRVYRDLSLGIVAVHEGRLDEAVRILSGIVDDAEVGAEAHFQRGDAKYLSMEFEAAAGDFAKAAELSPGWLTALIRVAQSHYAQAEVLAAASKDPRGHYREALRCIDAVARESMTEPAFIQRGNCHMRLASAMAARGESPDRHWEQAIDDFTKALALKPESTSALNNRGNTYSMRAYTGGGGEKDLLKAVADFDQALAIDSKSATPWNGRGLALWNLGEIANARKKDPMPHYEAAIASFGKALERDANYPEAHLNCGSTWFRIGEYEVRNRKDPRPSFDRALADFGKALDLAPGYLAARVNRGAVWLQYGVAERSYRADPTESWRRGLKDVNDVLHAAPGEVDALQIRGLLHYMGGQWMAAIEDWEQMIKLSPPMEASIKACLDDARIQLRRK